MARTISFAQFLTELIESQDIAREPAVIHRDGEPSFVVISHDRYMKLLAAEQLVQGEGRALEEPDALTVQSIRAELLGEINPDILEFDDDAAESLCLKQDDDLFDTATSEAERLQKTVEETLRRRDERARERGEMTELDMEPLKLLA